MNSFVLVRKNLAKHFNAHWFLFCWRIIDTWMHAFSVYLLSLQHCMKMSSYSWWWKERLRMVWRKSISNPFVSFKDFESVQKYFKSVQLHYNTFSSVLICLNRFSLISSAFNRFKIISNRLILISMILKRFKLILSRLRLYSRLF